MPATLRALLDRADLGLRLRTPDDRALLDQPISWLHSSDLADPTPFLTPGQGLLTTGTQFGTAADVDRADTDAYVSRLTDRGVVALGFGTEVVRDGTPEALIASCRDAGLALFEVPYRTSFIAVAQANAEITTHEENARNAWALAAQRAIALAAMRPDGLGATLAELSQQLDCWVGLLDVSGRLDRSFPADALDDGEAAVLRSEAGRILRGGHRASLPVSTAKHEFTLQTLGTGGRLDGVLAIGTEHDRGGLLDRAGREVVNAVIALAGLALQQNRELGRARGLLRTGLLTMLVSGNAEVVASTSRELWGPLPSEPIRVAALDVSGVDVDVLVDELELAVGERPGALFFALDDDALFLCTGAAEVAMIRELAVRYDTRAGLSDQAAYDSFARAKTEALQSLDRSRERESGVVEFSELAQDGVFAFLATIDAREVARAFLAPIVDHDAGTGTNITETVRVWLENDCEFDRTARVLGVHRHTARARIELAAKLLGRDLRLFATRADVWAAFLAGGEPARSGSADH